MNAAISPRVKNMVPVKNQQEFGVNPATRVPQRHYVKLHPQGRPHVQTSKAVVGKL